MGSRAPAARSAAARVFTDAALLRHVTAFQSGLPLALLAFFAQHDANMKAILETKTPFRLDYSSVLPLTKLAVAHGSVGLLARFKEIQVRGRSGLGWHRAPLHDVTGMAIQSGRLEIIKWALDNALDGAEEGFVRRELWRKACAQYQPGNMALFELLKTHRPLHATGENDPFFDDARHKGDLCLVQWIHDNIPGAFASKRSVEVLISAAANWGDIAVVRYACEHLSTEAITHVAYELALRRHDATILEFFVEKSPHVIASAFGMQRAIILDFSPEVKAIARNHPQLFRVAHGCVVKEAVQRNEFDRVSEWYSSGWLAKIAPISIDGMIRDCKPYDGLRAQFVAKLICFLHVKGLATASTHAIDYAARHGHLEIVRFLVENRSEGCTVNGIKHALNNGHRDIVCLLYKHYPHVFDATLLSSSLLCGAFAIYMKLQEKYPEIAVDEVMYTAGKRMELPTIRFIMDTMGRNDLATRAMDGAAYSGNLVWIHGLYSVTGPGSCQLSAVREAANPDPHVYPWNHIPFVVDICDDPTAREEVMNTIRATNEYMTDDVMTAWDKHKLAANELQLHPFFLDPRTPAWAIKAMSKHTYPDRFHFEHWSSLPSWPLSAVYRRDLTFLQVLRDLPSSAVGGNEGSAFSFVKTRLAAIHMGDLSILQWLVENVDVPIEPTLFSEALYDRQFKIAEWLLANYPSACTQFDWSGKCKYPFDDRLDPQGSLVDWLQKHEEVRTDELVSSMMVFGATTNDVPLLRQLYEWHPELFTPRSVFVEFPAMGEDSHEAIEFFSAIGWSAQKSTNLHCIIASGDGEIRT